MKPSVTPLVNLHQLRVFAAVVELGGLTAAAHLLSLTQPAISAQLRQLEHFSGAKLLAREGRRMAPTDAGAALYRYAVEVLSATDMLLQQVERIKTGKLDQVTVGGNPSYSAYVLPDLLARFHHAHPRVRLSLVAAQTPELVEQVRRDVVDLAVVVGERVPPELVLDTLGVDEFVVVESVDHPVSSGGQLSFDEAARLPFVRPAIGRERLTLALYRFFAEHGLEAPRIMMDLPTWEAVKEAVRAGVGAAIMLRGSAQRELMRGELRIVRIAGYADTRPISLVQSPRRAAQQPSTALGELMRWLRDELPVSTGLSRAAR